MSSEGSCVYILNNPVQPASPRSDTDESDNPFKFREVPFGARARKFSSKGSDDDSTDTGEIQMDHQTHQYHFVVMQVGPGCLECTHVIHDYS